MDMLTKEIEGVGVPIHELFKIEHDGTSHIENIRNQYFTETPRLITSSHYGTAAETSYNIMYTNLNDAWKNEQLLKWHFALNLPEGSWKPIKD